MLLIRLVVIHSNIVRRIMKFFFMMTTNSLICLMTTTKKKSSMLNNQWTHLNQKILKNQLRITVSSHPLLLICSQHFYHQPSWKTTNPSVTMKIHRIIALFFLHRSTTTSKWSFKFFIKHMVYELNHKN